MPMVVNKSIKHVILLMEKNPAPVDMVNIPLFTWFHTCQVVQDFFHQQYFFTNGPFK